MIRFTPRGAFGGTLDAIPAFPRQAIGLAVPEAVGDVRRPILFDGITVTWNELREGVWQSSGTRAGELSYALRVSCGEEHVDLRMELTNRSERRWEESFAFNCVNASAAGELRDHDSVRHWVGVDGLPSRLVELPRMFGPRPSVQAYRVTGAPSLESLPFAAGFGAVSDLGVEGWMAITSRDERRLLAVASMPALFLFHNREYSCVHASPRFGTVEPGGSASALTRVWLLSSSVQEWHRRMRAELDEETSGSGGSVS